MTDPYRTADPDVIIEKLREEIAGLKRLKEPMMEPITKRRIIALSSGPAGIFAMTSLWYVFRSLFWFMGADIQSASILSAVAVALATIFSIFMFIGTIE